MEIYFDNRRIYLEKGDYKLTDLQPVRVIANQPPLDVRLLKVEPTR
jgi:hypothetical protein